MATDLSHTNKEYTRLIKILDYRLHPKFKRIGIFGALLLLGFLLVYKFLGDGNMAPVVKNVISTLILFFMLLASLSKDKMEDEYNRHIRHQSYVIAFVSAVTYAVVLPLIATTFDALITKVPGDGVVNYHEVSSFEVIFILLGFQLLFFETLKRFGRA